jgi:hypothetical protein
VTPDLRDDVLVARIDSLRAIDQPTQRLPL